MAVPNTSTFSLQDVQTELGGVNDDLIECFSNANASGFDPTYEGSKNSLLNFRNYNHISEQGPFLPALATDVSDLGSTWTNKDQIKTDTGSSATYSASSFMLASVSSNKLRGSDYGFSIPSGATIKGIEVLINRSPSSGGETFTDDNIIELVLSGTVQGTGKADASTWANGYNEVIYGSPTDMWGATLTPTNINNSGFGVQMKIDNTNSGGGNNVFVAHIKIKIYW